MHIIFSLLLLFYLVVRFDIVMIKCSLCLNRKHFLLIAFPMTIGALRKKHPTITTDHSCGEHRFSRPKIIMSHYWEMPIFTRHSTFHIEAFVTRLTIKTHFFNWLT